MQERKEYITVEGARERERKKSKTTTPSCFYYFILLVSLFCLACDFFFCLKFLLGLIFKMSEVQIEEENLKQKNNEK